MGLSKSSRNRNSAAKNRPDRIASLEFAKRFQAANRWTLHTMERTLHLAVRRCVCLQRMQKQLQQTALALRQNPSSVIRPFQDILSRPSYFQAAAGSENWIILLGPAPRQLALEMAAEAMALPEAIFPHVFQYIAPQPLFPSRALRRARLLAQPIFHFSGNILRIIYVWLMHPMVDTREPS